MVSFITIAVRLVVVFYIVVWFATDCMFVFFLMIRRPPRATRTDTLFPYTTLFRSAPLPLPAIRRQRSPLDVTRQPSAPWRSASAVIRSEEHTSELQSLMRISYAVFCLKKKNHNNIKESNGHQEHNNN